MQKRTSFSFKFFSENLGDVHPNTAVIKAYGEKGGSITLQMSSVGGVKLFLVNLMV